MFFIELVRYTDTDIGLRGVNTYVVTSSWVELCMFVRAHKGKWFRLSMPKSAEKIRDIVHGRS